MKKLLVVCVIVFCLGFMLCACGQSQAQPTPSPVPTTTPVPEPSEEEQLFVKYEGIIRALENNDYDRALSSISQLKKEYMAANCGNINDYLVTVEITPENFDEYFEFVSFHGKNAFGEQDDKRVYIGLRSKKYDDGLLLYGLDDRQYSDDITIEFFCDFLGSDPKYDKLCSLVMFGYSVSSSNLIPASISLKSGRISGSRITFIKKEYVESYEIEPVSSPEKTVSGATITLINGEIIHRVVNPDFPY